MLLGGSRPLDADSWWYEPPRRIYLTDGIVVHQVRGVVCDFASVDE